MHEVRGMGDQKGTYEGGVIPIERKKLRRKNEGLREEWDKVLEFLKGDRLLPQFDPSLSIGPVLILSLLSHIKFLPKF
jgi:hypothetical protein